MGEIFLIGQSCSYLLTRAARHRRAGRFDQAMALLSKAQSQFREDEAVEYETARTYDEMGCDEEAVASYLRVVRMQGEHQARALFHLTLTSMQTADLERAISYFEALCASECSGVPPETVQMIKRQLLQIAKRPAPKTRAQWAKRLEQRAVERMHAGKIIAAKRAIDRSLSLRESAQGQLLKACCHLMTGQSKEAIAAANRALALRPGYINALCVLADAHLMDDDVLTARRILAQAACRAQSSDALLTIAIECAKCGVDELTLVLTKRLLKREPFHLRALALRACAFANIGCIAAAKQHFARLSALVPKNTVYPAYLHALDEGNAFSERLIMAQDVMPDEAMSRCMRMVSLLHEDPDAVRADQETVSEISRLCAWALHSEMAGENITMIAIILLSVVNTDETRRVLFDALTDPRLDENCKRSVLQAVCAHCEQRPAYVDLCGRFERLAAGAATTIMCGAQKCQSVVQRGASRLMPLYPDAAQTLLEMWVAYLNRYGAAKGRMADACAAALEYAYHIRAGRTVRMDPIARRAGVSRRLALLCARRILRAERMEKENTDETTEE